MKLRFWASIVIIFSSYSPLALILMLARHYSFTDEELDFIPSASLRTGINYD
ncbi:MAG: hypothetical protein NUV74_18775 [Candidatus Brocadiaceae bacterium]|nr:hypothetical protein [Candidatus Brocadiaceae bacterium]